MELSIVAAVNDEAVLTNTLSISPLVVAAAEEEVLTERGKDSASMAYNEALCRCHGDIVVFAHQDVYIPSGWHWQLDRAVKALADADLNWAVLGVFGMDLSGIPVGRTWSSGLNAELGGPFELPIPAQSADELLIVVRRDSGLRFDEGLPGFHLYGTDIVQTAIAAGFGAYVIHAPVVHNSNPVRRLGRDYWRAYDYMVQKWRHRLPISTCVMPLTTSPWPRIKYRFRQAKRWALGVRPSGGRQADPAAIARRLGYEDDPTAVNLEGPRPICSVTDSRR